MNNLIYMLKAKLIKKYLLLFSILFLVQAIDAQSNYFLDFENGDPITGFIQSDFPPYTSDCEDERSLGNNLNSGCTLFPNVPAQNGGNCMAYNHNDSDLDGTTRNIIRIIDNFVPGEYCFSFDLIKRFGNYSMSVNIVKGMNIPNATIVDNISIQQNANWNTYSGNITMSSTDNIFSLEIPNTTIFDDFAIDNIILERAEAPDFVFTDAAGNVVDKYCYGEDVYIVLSGGHQVSSFFFAVRKGCSQVNDYTIGEWNPYAENTPINLSQILRDKGKPSIKPDQLNCLKIAINHPVCGWTDRSVEFDYVCCDLDYAEFSLNYTPTAMISGAAIRDWSNYGGSHQFCIYTDLDSDGNFEEVICVPSASFNFQGQENVNYYILHTVTTPCGEFCELAVLCIGDDCPASTPTMGCESVVPPVCEAPSISCPEIIGGSAIITWTSVPDVLGYEFETIINDPACGCIGTPFTHTVHTTANQAGFPTTLCYSYKVRSICEFGASEWSPKICYPECLEETPEKELRIGEDEVSTSINVYPNPFMYDLNLEFSGLISEKIDVLLYDIRGTLIEKLSFDNNSGNLNEKWIPAKDLNAGIYFIKVIDGDKILTSKVIKQ